jgi:succinate-semialdehyde dehydrogenase/glutarate-semialdehyde dehydrogenase
LVNKIEAGFARCLGEIPLKEQLTDQGLLQTQAFINGRWVDAHDGATIDVTNPATGETLASVAKVGAAETAQAIEAAEKAMESWRNLAAKARANILRDWFNIIMAHQEDLARIMTL